MKDEKKVTFDTGSVRNELNDVRYDLISPVALRRLAETYALGAGIYGDRNWEKGQPFSVLLNHALDHINCYVAEQRGAAIMKGKKQGEDHISHAVWNLFALMHFQELMPALNDVGIEMNRIREVQITEEEIEKGEDLSKHYFHGASDKPCQACKAPRDDEIHYQPLEKKRSTEGE